MYKKLLAPFPKKRPALQKAELDLLEREYLINRKGRTLATRVSQRLEAWMHRRVSDIGSGATLELGAGTLNHLPYEKGNAGKYAYDIVEPKSFLYEDSQYLEKISNFYSDISRIDRAARYDRVISIATLEHVCNLPELVALSALHLNEGGYFINGIPSEGGLLWGLAWRFSTGLSYRLRTGHCYKNIMRHEHVNSSVEIEGIIRLFFNEVQVRSFPVNLLHLSLYSVVTARYPKKEQCESYLETLI